MSFLEQHPILKWKLIYQLSSYHLESSICFRNPILGFVLDFFSQINVISLLNFMSPLSSLNFHSRYVFSKYSVQFLPVRRNKLNIIHFRTLAVHFFCISETNKENSKAFLHIANNANSSMMILQYKSWRFKYITMSTNWNTV